MLVKVTEKLLFEDDVEKLLVEIDGGMDRVDFAGWQKWYKYAIGLSLLEVMPIVQVLWPQPPVFYQKFWEEVWEKDYHPLLLMSICEHPEKNSLNHVSIFQFLTINQNSNASATIGEIWNCFEIESSEWRFNFTP